MSDRKITLIMYHYVRDLRHSRYPKIKGLDLDLFVQQIDYLEKYYNFIRIQDLIESVNSGNSLPEKSILLTFDDNYSDHYLNVFPILDARGIQGCFYSPVRAITESKVLDVNKIHFILATAANPSQLINTIFRELDSLRFSFDLESNEYYFNQYAGTSQYDSPEVTFIKRLLQVGLPEEARAEITDRLFKKFVSISEETFSRELYMNLDQIKCMVRHGMHFGIHGYNHNWLNSLSKQEQTNEIVKAKEFLLDIGITEDEISVCYPYGGYNNDTLDVLTEESCQIAFTIKQAVANLEEYSRYELPRLDTNDIPKSSSAIPDKWYQMG